MIDIRTAKTSITHTFDLASSRAIQTACLDKPTGEFYCAQGSATGRIEDAVITRCKAPDAKGFCKRISSMRCVDAAHPSTIALLRLNGVLGIVLNWHGSLRWIAYKPGTFKKADSQPIFTNVARPNSFAYIDHDNNTVCIRKGTYYWLYSLNGDKAVSQIGKTIARVDQVGPWQGYFTALGDKGYQLFSLFGYGHAHQKQICDVRSFATGKFLYKTSTRVLGKPYTLQEPEGGFVINGVPYIGMSSRATSKKPIAVKFSVPVAKDKVADAVYKEYCAVKVIHRLAFNTLYRDTVAKVSKQVPNLGKLPEDARVVAIASQLLDNAIYNKIAPSLKVGNYWQAFDDCVSANTRVNRYRIRLAQSARIKEFKLDNAMRGTKLEINSRWAANATPTKQSSTAFWVQAMLRVAGTYSAKVDGLFGPVSESSLGTWATPKQLPMNRTRDTLAALSAATLAVPVI